MVYVGTFHLHGSPEMAPFGQRFDEAIDQIALADELGFPYAWIAEHHFSNYGYVANPLLLIAKASALAPRIRFAQGVLVTPFWHPLRLAEDVAMTDQLTHGRLDIGLGRGYQAMEFSGFDVPLADSRSLFLEQLELMKKAWTEDDFTFEGRHYRVSRPISVLPKPRQKPYPPIWVATTSTTTLDWIAQAGYRALIAGNTLTWADLRAWHDRYIAGRRAGGHSMEDVRLGILRHIYVAETEAEARAAVWQTRWQRRISYHLGQADERISGGRNDAYPAPDEADDDEWWNRLIYGTPDRIVDQIRRNVEAGVTDILGWFDVGGLPQEQVLRSMRLFAAEVLPKVRDLWPAAEADLAAVTGADAAETAERVRVSTVGKASGE